ncbi:MAG: hypothetical protein V4542_03045 [Pseudomonadota bacterium]
MRHFPAVFMVSTCVAVFAQLALAARANAQVQFPVGPPTPKVGDTVRYRTIDLWNNSELSTEQSELVEIQADRFTTRFKRSTESEARTRLFNREWQSCRPMYNSPELLCAGPLKFPLQAGAKHTYDKQPWTSGFGYDAATCEVKGEEKVTVAAGTFDAVRLDCTGFWNRVFNDQPRARDMTGKITFSVWYSPAISREIKSQYASFNRSGSQDIRSQTELLEFIPGK